MIKHKSPIKKRKSQQSSIKKSTPIKTKNSALSRDVLSPLKRSKSAHPINLAFNSFAKKISDLVGNALAFIIALIIVLGWGISGHFFKYSDTWQLVINTGTTIITFLIVFLIQNTQNRDTEIFNLKLDELITSKKGARNHIINLNTLSDPELKQLEKEYIKLCNKRTGQ